jgi:hypothetical protein
VCTAHSDVHRLAAETLAGAEQLTDADVVALEAE